MVDVQGHWVEVGWVRGSHSLCGGSLCCAICLRLRPPSTSGPPDVSPVLITGSTASSRKGVGGSRRKGSWRWRDEVEGEQPGWEGGNGVTLTEPVVDKTLRQIRQNRVWSLFCFPLLLLSGGISLLLLSDIRLFFCPLSIPFFRRNQFVKLFSSTTPPLSVQTEIFLLLSAYVRYDHPWIEEPFLLWLPRCVFVFSLQCFHRGRSLSLTDSRRKFLTVMQNRPPLLFSFFHHHIFLAALSAWTLHEPFKDTRIHCFDDVTSPLPNLNLTPNLPLHVQTNSFPSDLPHQCNSALMYQRY